MSSRRLPAFVLLAFAVSASASADAARIDLVPWIEGVPRPVAVVDAGDDRLFVVSRHGTVHLFADGVLRDQPFLDLRDRVTAPGEPVSEQGLLSLVFDPAYAINGRLFAYYTDLVGDSVLSRFDRGDDPDRIDPTSEKVLLEFPQPDVTHNGGDLHFGPDGYLYLSTGDGSTADVPPCTAQDRSLLLGKVLRLDVSRDEAPFVAIPPDNPFVGDPEHRPEIFLYGFRNPWRTSFDRLTGDFFVGDVGWLSREEIDFLAAGAAGGGNYGWKRMEGSLCVGTDQRCRVDLPPCDDPSFVPPILEYEHGFHRCAVIGGFVYRGREIPELWGRYLFGDLCGTTWVASRRDGGWQSTKLETDIPRLVSWGEDAAGELYAIIDEVVFKVAGADLGAIAEDTLVLGDRFTASATWRTSDGRNGAGRRLALTEDAGAFWFFAPANLELLVKVIDACDDPWNRFWVFVAGLTDLEVELTVTDTATGVARVYENTLGTPFAPIQDTDAFATCP